MILLYPDSAEAWCCSIRNISFVSAYHLLPCLTELLYQLKYLKYCSKCREILKIITIITEDLRVGVYDLTFNNIKCTNDNGIR